MVICSPCGNEEAQTCYVALTTFLNRWIGDRCSITSLDSVQSARQEHIRVGKMIIIHFDEGNFGR